MKDLMQVFYVLSVIILLIVGIVFYFGVPFIWSDLITVLISICFLFLSRFVWLFAHKLPHDYFIENNRAVFINLLSFAVVEALISGFISGLFNGGLKVFLFIFTVLFGLTLSALLKKSN